MRPRAGGFMSADRLRHYLFGPTTGDQLLAAASSAKIELTRWPVENSDGQTAVDVTFELRGELPAGVGAVALLWPLRELQQRLDCRRRPGSRRRPGGGRMPRSSPS